MVYTIELREMQLQGKYMYNVQLLSKIFIDSDFCHNYLHTLYLFACLL